jgi:metal-dependent amidase/aminoacylase/carboxypeptidase family protein
MSDVAQGTSGATSQKSTALLAKLSRHALGGKECGSRAFKTASSLCSQPGQGNEPMNAETNSSDRTLSPLASLLPDLETLYTDIHAHPELSMQETRTSRLAADRLRAAGYEVTTGIGRTGVVGLLRSGDGPTVMLRADMDALPVEEATGLPYASQVKAADREGKTVPVMHACGHDMHVTWLVGVTTLMAQARQAWRGTLMAVFQPGEETAEGARAMIDDGLFKRFAKPDVVLGQHVMVGPAGTVGGRAGPSPPRPTACRSDCSGAAPTARCRRPASIRW